MSTHTEFRVSIASEFRCAELIDLLGYVVKLMLHQRTEFEIAAL